jgi:hypothetical protein
MTHLIPILYYRIRTHTSLRVVEEFSQEECLSSTSTPRPRIRVLRKRAHALGFSYARVDHAVTS